MLLFTIGMSLVSFTFFRALWLIDIKDYDECGVCGWNTKNKDGSCVGCGRPPE